MEEQRPALPDRRRTKPGAILQAQYLVWVPDWHRRWVRRNTSQGTAAPAPDIALAPSRSDCQDWQAKRPRAAPKAPAPRLGDDESPPQKDEEDRYRKACDGRRYRQGSYICGTATRPGQAFVSYIGRDACREKGGKT